MTKYHLGTIKFNLSESNPDSQIGFNLDKELSKSEFDLFIQSILVINTFISDSQLFNIVLWNYKDFFQTINNYLFTIDKKDASFINEYPVDINLNRLFLNLLSSVRSYLDFMDRKLKNKFGINNEVYILFDQDRTKEFETKFSYRFLEDLRHYAQHKGFPIGSIQFGKRLSNEIPNKQEIYLNLFFMRDALLNNFVWKKQLRQEIEAMPTKIQVIPQIESYIESIKIIHENSMNRLLDSLNDSASFIVNNCRSIQNTIGNIVLLESQDEINGERKISQIEIPLKTCEEILEKK